MNGAQKVFLFTQNQLQNDETLVKEPHRKVNSLIYLYPSPIDKLFLLNRQSIHNDDE